MNNEISNLKPTTETQPTFELYNKLGKSKIDKNLPLYQLVNLSSSNEFKKLKKVKSVISKWRSCNQHQALTQRGKEQLNKQLYFYPSDGTVIAKIYNVAWCWDDTESMISYISHLPYIGTIIANEVEREIIIIAKAPTDQYSYDSYVGVLINELAKTDLTAHVVPAFRCTPIEIPYDPNPKMTNNWLDLDSLTLPASYSPAK